SEDEGQRRRVAAGEAPAERQEVVLDHAVEGGRRARPSQGIDSLDDAGRASCGTEGLRRDWRRGEEGRGRTRRSADTADAVTRTSTSTLHANGESGRFVARCSLSLDATRALGYLSRGLKPESEGYSCWRRLIRARFRRGFSVLIRCGLTRRFSRCTPSA